MNPETGTIALSVMGSCLVTRSMGAAAAGLLMDRLGAMPEPSVLSVDFSGVGIMDYPFADEAVGKPLAICTEGGFPGRYLVATSLTPDLEENLSSALRLRDLPLIAHGPGSWRVIGNIKPHLLEALEHVMANQSGVTARELGERVGIALNAASNRLIELHRLRLAVRHEAVVNGGGKQFVYGGLAYP